MKTDVPSPNQTLSPQRPQPADPLFDGPGEMRALCRSFDWSATPLGVSHSWPVSLRTIVSVVLGSRNPMFLFWGPDLIQIYNDAYRPSLGRHGGRHPRALGMRGADFWTDIWDTIGPQIEQVLTTGEATWHEDQYLPIERNDRLDDVWWTYSYGPAHDDEGRVCGVLVVCQETTQRVIAEREQQRLLTQMVEAERALRDSEALLRGIFDAAYEYIGLISPDGTVLDCNRASLEFVSNSREDVIGLKLWDTPWFSETPGAATRLRDDIARAAQGEFVRYEATLLRPPHEPITFDFSLLPVRNDVGEVVYIVPEGRDITYRKRAEEALRESEARYRLERARLAELFRQSPSFLAVLRGPDFVFELANYAYYTLIGHRDIIGRPFLDALPELRGQGFLELLEKVRTTGEPFVGREVPVVLARETGANPEERFADFVCQPLHEADGTISGVAAYGHDVTEQVRSRREVERLLAVSEHARAEAESANRVKAQFLTVMSHELRTPLNAIGGYTDLLQMGVRGTLNEDQVQFVERIQLSQRHLLGLINEVLSFAKLETGGVSFNMADTPVCPILASAQALVQPQAEARGLTLVPIPCDEPIVAHCDPEKLRQIVVNLLSNAVKFTDSGTISVGCFRDEGQVRVKVRDTGIGIAEDAQSTIFDPFVQVHSDLARRYEGTGLGLAISRDLARGMGGDITVESAAGRGSTFTLTLPAA
jgi:PAS domain S-box-containing protein